MPPGRSAIQWLGLLTAQISHTATIWERESIIFQCDYDIEIGERNHGMSLRTVTCVNKSVNQPDKMSEQNNWLFSITRKWLKSKGQPRRLTET